MRCGQSCIHLKGKSWKLFSAALIGRFTVLSQPTENDVTMELEVHLGDCEEGVAKGVGHTVPLVAEPSRTRGRTSRRDKRWNKRYRNQLRISDLVIISLAVAGAQFLRFGTRSDEFFLSTIPGIDVKMTYTLLSVLLILGWTFSLSILGARDYKIVGSGTQEYKAVLEASVRLFGTLAIVDLLFKLSISRGYLLISFPTGVLLLLISRWFWRKWLYRRRRQGRCLDRAVIVGEPTKSQHVANQIQSAPGAGLKIVGIITEPKQGLELFGANLFSTDFSAGSVINAVDKAGADTIVLTGEDRLCPHTMRELGWAAEERGIDLVVAPALTDVAGPRIHTRPMAGLPLIHIEHPEITGLNYWIKRTFDVLGSAVLLLLLSPLFLTVAILIKVSSPGPAFYKQERIGQDGKPFQMFKFRSMIVNADAELKELLEAQGTADKPLFKVENDPRITPIGRFIRKYSIDELPQLLNSLLGSMSLVGPRPQVAGEVALYDDAAFRRLMVKPGMTGLWQVSGRSDLSWEDAIRLDLYYVENWSLAGDFLILLRTAKAVLASDGAC